MSGKRTVLIERYTHSWCAREMIEGKYMIGDLAAEMPTLARVKSKEHCVPVVIAIEVDDVGDP